MAQRWLWLLKWAVTSCSLYLASDRASCLVCDFDRSRQFSQCDVIVGKCFPHNQTCLGSWSLSGSSSYLKCQMSLWHLKDIRQSGHFKLHLKYFTFLDSGRKGCTPVCVETRVLYQVFPYLLKVFIILLPPLQHSLMVCTHHMGFTYFLRKDPTKLGDHPFNRLIGQRAPAIYPFLLPHSVGTTDATIQFSSLEMWL